MKQCLYCHIVTYSHFFGSTCNVPSPAAEREKGKTWEQLERLIYIEIVVIKLCLYFTSTQNGGFWILFCKLNPVFKQIRYEPYVSISY